MVHSEELAWAAGFFDAEGCFSYTTAGRYASVAIVQTDDRVLERFQGAVGTGQIHGPYSVASPGRYSKRPQYSFRAYKQSGFVRIATALWPWLSPIKRAQATRVMKQAQLTGEMPPFIQERTSGTWPDRFELAWAAGFCDGEGSFMFPPSTGYPRFGITQTDDDVLHRFRQAVARGKVYGPYASRVRDQWNHKPSYNYVIHGFEQIQIVTALLWFKLDEIKQAQAAAVLTRWPKTCHRGHPKIHGHKACARCTADYWAARREGRLYI